MGIRSLLSGGKWNVAPALPPSSAAAPQGPEHRRDAPLVRAAIAAVEPLERRALLSGDTGLLDLAGGDAGALLDFIFELAKKNKNKGGGGDDEREEDEDEDKDDKHKDKEDDDDDDDDSGSGGGGGNSGPGGGGDGGGNGGGGVINPPADVTAPTAAISVSDVTATGGRLVVSVTYSDDVIVARGSIDHADVVVQRGGSGLSLGRAVEVSATPDASSTPLTATYVFNAPGGDWGSDDNGLWSATVQKDRVYDQSGNTVQETTAQFNVSVAPPAPAASPPLATLSPVRNVTRDDEGAAGSTVVVTYSDDAGVNASTIGTDDIIVTRDGGGRLDVTGLSVAPGADGKSYTATYTVLAPGSSWSADDTGSYTVTVHGGAVSDATGTPSAAVTGRFTVEIATAPAPLDTNFSSGGLLNSGFLAQGAVVQTDGRILVAGREGDLSAGTSRYVLKRYNPDGSLDGSFGNRGQVTSPQGFNDAAYAIALADDGGILLAGSRDGDFLVTKYKANGSLDTRFGDRGAVVSDFGTDNDAAYALALAPDGSVVAAGGAGEGTASSFAFARYHADGAPDTFFGDRGRAIFSLSPGGNAVGGVAVQADGRVVAVGSTGGGVAVLRLNADGNEDASFGGDGARNLPALASRVGPEGPDHTQSIAVQPDGKLVIANRTAGGDFAVTRLHEDGRVDSSFAGDGVATVDFGGEDDADVVVVQGTGEVIVFGTTDAGGSAKTAVATLRPNGSLDTGFAEGGKYTVDAGLTNPGRALQIGNLILRAFGGIQPNGQLVFGSSSTSPQGNQSSAGLRRLNVPGSGPLGRFGLVGNRNRNLSFIDADGTRVLLSLKGPGSGRAYYDGSRVDLVLTGTDANTTVSVRTRGGNGWMTLRNVQAGGALRAFNAKAADVTGTFAVKGGVGAVQLRTLTGTIAAAGSIGTFAAAGDVGGAKVLAGANLGSDNLLGGSGTAADTYAAASIGAIRVGGAVTGSVFGAGLNPVDDTFLDRDDEVEGGDASTIGAVRVRKGVDDATRFVAGAFTSVARLPERVDPADDPRFKVM